MRTVALIALALLTAVIGGEMFAAAVGADLQEMKS